jgi:transcriptional regulator with XRE-family HTH domain
MKNANLKAALFEEGITQRDLSQKTGIPRAYISLAINGKFNLDSEQKQKISVVLARDERDLFSE